MKQVKFIGDIHAELYDYRIAINNELIPSIQVGDFGYGFFSEYQESVLEDHFLSGDHRFIRGNHDDPARVKNSIGYIEDGTVENNMMFIGGAYSIDRQWRTAGVNYWPDEECSIQDFEHFIEIYSIVKPDIMVTHDAPCKIANRMFVEAGLTHSSFKLRTLTGNALEVMFEIHQPKLWVFGHWHITKRENIEGTEFLCVGAGGDSVVVDLDEYSS